MKRLVVMFGVAVAACPTAAAAEEPKQPVPSDRATPRLVEEFTAYTLPSGQVKLGTEFEIGVTDDLMLGTDLISSAVGAPTLAGKLHAWQSGAHRVALGIRLAYLSKDTFLWGSVNEHFDRLEARIARPSLSWTHEVSERLNLHTFWAKGLGEVNASLSEKGRRKLWETKHPGEDYDDRSKPSDEEEDDDETPEDETNSDKNQEKLASEESSLTQQSIQVQSITGLARDRFQLTGEFIREGGNRVLVSSRIEKTKIEDLTSNFFRLTAAHQWIFGSFQMRLGVGFQYFVMSGEDLDGEEIDDSGVQPASDIAFYWRF